MTENLRDMKLCRRNVFYLLYDFYRGVCSHMEESQKGNIVALLKTGFSWLWNKFHEKIITFPGKKRAHFFISPTASSHHPIVYTPQFFPGWSLCTWKNACTVWADALCVCVCVRAHCVCARMCTHVLLFSQPLLPILLLVVRRFSYSVTVTADKDSGSERR